MIPGDTVRIKTDNPHEAPVRAGECGKILDVRERAEGTVYTIKVGTVICRVLAEDVDPVDVAGDFRSLMETLDLDALMPLADLYDADDPEIGTVPSEPGLNLPEIVVPTGITSGGGTAVAEEDEDCDCGEDEICEVCAEDAEHVSCPDGPHIHEEDGTAVALPFVGLEDGDGDRLIAVNITKASEDSSAPERVLSVRLMGNEAGILEVHLTEGQALMLGTFLFRQYGPNRPE